MARERTTAPRPSRRDGRRLYSSRRNEMAVEVERARRLFTIKEYVRMHETGILKPDDRVELIEGEIVEMSPIGDPHAAFVANLTHLLVHAVGEQARVWVQGPVRIPPRSL